MLDHLEQAEPPTFQVRVLRIGVQVTIVAAAMVAVTLFARHASRNPSVPPRNNPGDIVVLQVPAGEAIVLVANSRAYQTYVKHLRSRDAKEIAAMHERKEVFDVETTTKAEVVTPGRFHNEVRLLEGPHASQTGIVPRDYCQLVRKSRPTTSP
jgi:hypothetical protein